MQVHYTTKTFNYLISATCIVAIIICYLELFNKNLNSTGLSLSAIGQITNISNNVKRKSEDFLGWQEVTQVAPLAANNLVFTHKNSTAQIKVATNTISLGPETMIEIKSQDSLSLNQGKMDIEFNPQSKPLKVTSGESTYLLKSAGAKISFSKNEHTSTVFVKEGLVNFQDLKTKKIIEVSKDQSLKISQSKYELISSNITLETPTEGENFNSDRPIEFKVLSKLKKLELQISLDQSFKRIYKSQTLNDSLKLKINPNEYFWRIKSGNIISESRAFKVVDIISAPKLYTPRVNFEKVYYADTTNLYFSWAENNAKRWLLEIFDKDENLVFFKETSKPNYLYTTQIEGTHKWSVTPLIKHSEIQNQKFYSFTLRKEKLENIKSVILELKKPNQKVNFSWIASPNKISIFELSKDKDFTTLITSKRLKSNKTSIVFPQIGTYYWRSFVLNAKGVKKYNKPIRLTLKPNPKPKKPKKLPSLKLKLKTQVIKKGFHFFPRAYASTQGAVLLTWPKVENAKEYEIEIFTDQGLTRKIKTIKTSKSSFKWQAPRAGQFFWRYRFEDFWGRLSPFSDGSQLELIAEKKGSSITKDIATPNKVTRESKMSFAYLLTMVDYKNQNADNFIIDGVSTNGFELSYQLKRFKLAISSITGDVFDNEQFVHRKFELSHQTTINDLHFDSGVLTTMSSLYDNKDSSAVGDGTMINYFLFGGANVYWHQNKLKTTLKLGYGSGILFNLATSYYFYSLNQFKYFLMGHGEIIRVNSTDQDLESQQFQLSVGSTYSF